ncbi:hypothetical protein SAMN05720781_0630 [Fibrobacter sp. UWT3]|uniref:hypothetical protein n=1 Tax=Fibrobacter sp. UWT3 TaxID=1896225 RepID=UPI000BD07AF1|nr:hypothetical protein [Fibrobacter sp. UWT3]SOE53642.1 hypothetical protein SAMN05720781_0630 [Fibrobacter sp. UWT3]
MKRIVLAALAATLMLSSGAWAGFSIHVDNNKKSERRNDPPPPPRERLECRFEKPDCRPRDRHYRVDYRNRRPMVEGECYRGDADGRWDYYCNDGTRWMSIDFRRNRPGRVDCLDPRRGRFFDARDVRECVRIHDR